VQMANLNVGVNIIEGIGASPISGVSTAISGLLGTFERGPLQKATLVSSMSQFERIFGSSPAAGSTSWYSVKAFFKKVGASPLYIVRVAGATAAKASRTYNDSGAAAAVKLEAKDQGTWGNQLSAAVAESNILSTKPFANINSTATTGQLVSVEGLEVGSDLKFYNGTNTEYRRITAIESATRTITWVTGLTNSYTTANGVLTSQEFSVALYVNGILESTFTGLGVNSATSFYVNKKLISDFIVGTFIKVTPVNSYLDLPAPLAVSAFTSGADGLSDVLAAGYSGSQVAKTGVYAFDDVDGLFRFCCPNPLLTDGTPTTAYEALVQALIDYANTRVTCMYYGDIPIALSVANAKVFGDKFTGRRLVFFWPWLKVVESSLDVWLPPSSFVMGVAVEKDFRRGVHKNLGNETIPYTIDTEYALAIAESELLNNAGINPIRKFVGEGIKTYGGRTKAPSSTTAWRFVHYSELWNYIGESLKLALSNVIFEPHNVSTWKSVIRRVTAFLSNEHRRGALFDASDPVGTPYSIVMDTTNNPPDQVALGIANLKVEYVPVGTIEKFAIDITSSPSGLTIND